MKRVSFCQVHLDRLKSAAHNHAREFMRHALRLARRGYGTTAPNPMVGAVLVKGGKIIGQGWHRRAGGPHAEVEALLDAKRKEIGRASCRERV